MARPSASSSCFWPQASVFALIAGVLLLLASSCSRSSSTGGARQRFITFNPNTGRLTTVDIHPRDAIFLDDHRDLGLTMDGFAASEFGSVAIVYDDSVSFLVFVSYASPGDLQLVTTDIGRVPFTIGDVTLSPDGSFAVFENDTRREVQLLDLTDLNNLRYSSAITLAMPIASLHPTPDSKFTLIFPEVPPEVPADQLLVLSHENLNNPLVEFTLPTTEVLQFFEFVEDNPSVALGIETGTGRLLTFVLENAVVSGEAIGDVLTLANPEIRAAAFIPSRQAAYVTTSDGVARRFNFENPFRVFVENDASFMTNAIGDDQIAAVSPDEEIFLISADQGLEIYDISNRTNPTLLRRFDFGSSITEIGFSSENRGSYLSDQTAFVVLLGSTIHLIDLRDRRLPELSPGAAFPSLTARVQQDDPIGGRLSGIDSGGSVFYVSITLREADAPESLGPFGVNPPIQAGYDGVTFFVR